MIEVKTTLLNQRQIERALNSLPSRGAKRAFQRTLDQLSSIRGKNSIVRKIATEIDAQTGLKKNRVLKEYKRTQRPKQNKLVAIVRPSDERIPIADYSPTFSRQQRTTAVSADISAKAGRGSQRLDRVFRPLGKRGKKHIHTRYKRPGGGQVSRYPITTAKGPSAAVQSRYVLRQNLPEYSKASGELLIKQIAVEFDKQGAARGQP